MTEYQIQKLICEYLDILNLCYAAVPNAGKRTYKYAAMMRATGLQKGFPDLLIFEPRGKYCGLALEIKRQNGKPTVEQMEWLRRLENKGWMVHICYGYEQAKNKIDQYLYGI